MKFDSIMNRHGFDFRSELQAFFFKKLEGVSKRNDDSQQRTHKCTYPPSSIIANKINYLLTLFVMLSPPATAQLRAQGAFGERKP